MIRAASEKQRTTDQIVDGRKPCVLSAGRRVGHGPFINGNGH